MAETVEEQTVQRPNLLAVVEEMQGDAKDTSFGDSKYLSDKCLLGGWLLKNCML